MKTFNCKNCIKENKWSYSTTNTYCDNKCQREYEYSQRIKNWLTEGQANFGNQTPRWAKRYLLEQCDGKCQICGISEWNEKPIVLECDHIDGDHKNNAPNNLRMICPNCHSQTDTYKAKNTGNGRESRRKG